MRQFFHRQIRHGLIACIVLLLCILSHLLWNPIAPLQAAPSDRPADQTSDNHAMLLITLDRQGQATFSFSAIYEQGKTADDPKFKLRDWSGMQQELRYLLTQRLAPPLLPDCSLQEPQEMTYDGYWGVEGKCQGKNPGERNKTWTRTRSLHLTPLLQEFSTVGLETLYFRLSLPKLDIAQIVSPLTRMPLLPPIAEQMYPTADYDQFFRVGESVEPIAITLGYSPGWVLLRGLVIPGLIGGAIAVLLYVRRQTLQTPIPHSATLWSSYWRKLHGLGVVLWITWFCLYVAIGFGDILTWFTGSGLIGEIVQTLGLLGVPAIALALCAILSHPVFVQLQNKPWTNSNSKLENSMVQKPCSARA
ncbi:MAG: hypothetical protein MUF49_30300 [Oculatellaceae cyanobacterium Prado106]|jgi:hypothetical protein|nr:hypothetical protein [Oculatellaceae cyanobacterium Prado106]